MSNAIKTGTFFFAALVYAYGSIGVSSEIFAQETITFPYAHPPYRLMTIGLWMNSVKAVVPLILTSSVGMVTPGRKTMEVMKMPMTIPGMYPSTLQPQAMLQVAGVVPQMIRNLAIIQIQTRFFKVAIIFLF